MEFCGLFVGGLFLYVQFRRIPSQLDAWLALAKEQQAARAQPRPYQQSRRLAQASGVGLVDVN